MIPALRGREMVLEIEGAGGHSPPGEGKQTAGMDTRGAQTVEFSQPVRQIALMLTTLALVGAGVIVLAPQVQQVLSANYYLNGFILTVFGLGIVATFWQVAQVTMAVAWLRNLQAGFKGHEFTQAPRLVASMAPFLREGRIRKRLAASSTRSILDSIGVRIDEARDITRYIASLLIFLGLLGTFWGLSITVPAVVETIRSLAPQPGDTGDTDVFDRLMVGLENQLGGMGTAFASSLVGLVGSLVIGLLELFASHGQNRFYRELEEWLTSFTKLGLVSEGEGPEGALVAILERVDDALERTAEFATRAEQARTEAENRVAEAADVIAEIAHQIERERSQVAQLVGEIRAAREAEAGRDHAALTVLKRIDQGLANQASAQAQIFQLLESVLADKSAAKVEAAMRGHLDSIDRQMRILTDEIALGRHEAMSGVLAELRQLIRLIDERTREPGPG